MTSAPNFFAIIAIRLSSVAIITALMSLALIHRRQTCSNTGLPAMGCKSLPGKRVDPQRAGMMIAVDDIKNNRDENQMKGIEEIFK